MGSGHKAAALDNGDTMSIAISTTTTSNKSFVQPKRFQSRETRRARAFYLFLAPWLIGLVFVWLIPLLTGLLMSMTNYDGLNLANI